jgi:hypothetical protein
MSWKKANEGGGLVWCHDSGTSCHATPKTRERLFAVASKQSVFFDASLEQLAEGLNRLVRDTQAEELMRQGRDARLQIGLLRTGAGYLPVWKREVTDSESLADLVDIESLTDLDSMTVEQRDVYLKVKKDGGDAGDWRNHSSSGGVVHCHHAGMSCFVTVKAGVSQSASGSKYFADVDRESPLHDPALSTLSLEMNDLVGKAQAAASRYNEKDARLQIGFVSTGAGLLPVWKRVLADNEQLEEVTDAATLTHLDALSEEQLDAHFGVE